MCAWWILCSGSDIKQAKWPLCLGHRNGAGSTADRLVQRERLIYVLCCTYINIYIYVYIYMYILWFFFGFFSLRFLL